MADKALLFYGLDSHESERARDVIAQSITSDVDRFSASGMENTVIGDFLEDTSNPVYSSGETRFIMFLGLNHDEIRTAMRVFPADIARPIFCTLTEKNVEWTFAALAEHLIEEHRAAAGR